MMGYMLALCVVLCVGYSHAAYQLTENMEGNDFLNHWSFFTAGDPTHGYVNYVDKATALEEKLITTTGNSVYIGVDNRNKSTGRGRNSVRLNSNAAYNTGLFILDLTHMPTGCGTWPAWWLCGPNWPNNGEIDIIEGVNTQTNDATSMHTKNGCSMSGESASLFTGKMNTANCYVDASGQSNNAGCGITGPGNSYGAPFNNQNGGIYALEWTTSFIRAFYFPRNGIPSDVTSASPNPSSWGKPYAYFELGNNCPSNFFQNMNMVIDLTFCGDWAGAVFASQCPGKGTCQTYVQNTPNDFKEAYWNINYIKVFQNR